MRSFAIAAVVCACGCVTLTTAGSNVRVFRAPLEAPLDRRAMPADCRLVAATQPIPMTELEIEGQKNPFARERNAAGANGGNALLVLSKEVIGRRNFDCPSASPITDCPGDSGAWFRIAFETYACTPEALLQLSTKSR
jgi:hypothetical protein